MKFLLPVILVVFAFVMWIITLVYKRITGKQLDLSPAVREGDISDSPLKHWMNDRKLTKRWQVAESMTLVNEGKSTVGNKEDRFHLTSMREEILSEKECCDKDH